MEVNTIDDIIRLIKYRDKLSLIEARTIVDDCIFEIKQAIQRNASLDEIEEIWADYVSLEPDYLDIIFAEMY